MATRPIFVPSFSGFPFVKRVLVDFDWYPGFAKTQAQKSMASLHHAAAKRGVSPVLEISSKSPDPVGVSLSAFNLMLSIAETPPMSVECAYQGSKVFEKGGPYMDLYSVASREAKTDERLRNSGNLIAFSLLGQDYPIYPATAFYDWLYITALSQNDELATKLLEFQGFSDITFNPKRSINCQAHSAALYVSFRRRGVIERVLTDREYYISLITNGEPQDSPPPQTAQQLSLLPE
jgi:hypothetical protein